MPIAAALMVAALMLIPSAGNANEAAAQAISVEGNHRIGRRHGALLFPPAADGRFDAASLDAALKALIATGLFEHVEIGHNGERLIVHLTEAKVLDRVVFEGNKKIKDKELEGVVQSKPRGTLQRAWYRPTSTASWKPTAMPGATMSGSCLKSSTAATTGSILSMR